MAITRVGGSWIHKYVSLVADDVTHTYTRAAKPDLNLPNGSRCFEMDSDTEYIYDVENDAWEVYVPSGGGSGGTTNYNQLSNKPLINNVELSGNKSLAALGINAGSIGFDETETYTDGSVGKELSDQKNAISQKQDAPSTAGTAGQVLGLDSNLNPAWVDQTGGGGGMNIVNLSGTQITQVGADNTFYVCGELTELTFTAPSVGITMIRFTSGTTPTVCTINGVTKWMYDFDPTTDIEASKTYDINVLNGIGVAGWA